jgi:cytochrome P450/NADPH-cytochrome P450 reductase
MASKQSLASIPHPRAKPLVGNMLSIDTKAPVQNLARLAKELGPIYWLDLMGVPLIIVSGIELVDELSDTTRFDKKVRGPLKRLRVLGGDGLFTADTEQPNWSKAHNILLTPFSSRAMHSYHPMMVDIAEQLVKKWERLNADEEIDVVHDMTALTLDTIGLCGFDYRFNSFYRRDYHPYVEALVRSLETVMMTRGLPLEGLFMRERRGRLDADIAFMNGMVDEIIAERRKQAEAAGGKVDLLGAMMKGVDRASGEQLDDINIRYQITTFLIAGHETTSGLLSCSIYAIMKNPEVAEKAYAEVDRVLGADLDAKPTYEQVSQLTYIQQILKEALRLWPPAPAYSIAPLKDEKLGGKYDLKKGTFVTVLTLALHRDPKAWGPNPDAFNPENFSREAESKRPINAWKPFGNGQRACIGRGFAMHEAALALGLILQRFRLIDHTRYQMKLKETLTIKPDGFRIKVKPRTDAERAKAPALSIAAAAATSGAATTARARPSHNTPLTVLYGSNLGTAEELATRVADLAGVNGFAVKLSTLDDAVGKLPTQGDVIVFSASYNGAPPDNAANFVKWLRSDLASDAFAGVRFAVFGCGNRDWAATYQAIPRLIDDELAAHGASRLLERGEGDAREDLGGQFEEWFAKLRALAAKELGAGASFSSDAGAEPLYRVEPVAADAAAAPLAAAGAAPMKVLANRKLQTFAAGAPERSTRHIEIALPAGVAYQVGDHLSVAARNDPALVDSVARRFGFQPSDRIRLAAAEGRRPQLPVGEPISVGRLLTEFVELQQPATRKQIQSMAASTRCPVTKPTLIAFVGDDEASAERYRAEVLVKRKSAFDLMEEFPAIELPFAAYLESLSPLAPRYYSISSAPVVDPSRCSITVAVVQGPAASGKGVFKGAASNYLATRREGDTIQATIRPTKAGFRLPEDAKVPLIMIGPGTGLAPFRGFLQQRAYLKSQGEALGPAMLFFGCRHPEQDFLYADELKAFADQGIVELHVAFSRAGDAKAYVQHRIADERERVAQLIDAGAIIFICGDGSKMEPDVKRALIALQRERAGVDEDAARRWIEDLGARGRYVLDVWSGN